MSLQMEDHADPQVVIPHELLPISLVKSICERLKKLLHKQPLMLPIKKIQNISVEVTITKINKNLYQLKIIPTEFYVNEGSLLGDLFQRQQQDTCENDFLNRSIQNILRDLKNIKIDKLHGQFVTSNEESGDWTEFYQEFKDIENIVLTMNECCVCFILTETTTNCGHTVCLECISKLTSITEEEDRGEYVDHKNCPMCRQRITCLRRGSNH